MHNGVLAGYAPDPISGKSDTREFIDTVLKPSIATSGLSACEFVRHTEVKKQVESIIGRGNKLATLSPGGFAIFNEQAGEWVDGVWYSAGYPTLWEPTWTEEWYREGGDICNLCGEYADQPVYAYRETLCESCHRIYVNY
jgi:hypothetical protein